MRLGLANKFFLMSILLYFVAGAMALLKIKYSILALIAAVIFLAFGFVINTTTRWKKLFKRSA